MVAFIAEPQTLWIVAQPADSGNPACLARRGLALAGLQHAAHQHFINKVRIHTCALDGCLDGYGTETGGGEAAKGALKGTHRRAGGGNNNDRVRHEFLLCK
jgi:hypothetical protein